MTTTNGGRIVEHLSGVVASANDRGVKLEGDDGEGWRNFSKYGEPITPPRRGQRVSLGLDASGFVRELQVLDAAAAPSSAAPTLRETTITRLACLKAAATFCGGKALNTEVSTQDVLKIAEAFERWVLKGGEQPV
jgi:hypothetical protein